MKIWKCFLLVVGCLILILFFIRLFLPIQLDDVTPGIYCEVVLLDTVDVYYVIPKFENVSINKEWCEGVLTNNKKLAMHGVYHSFEEFGEVRDGEYFQEGVDIFEECFGFVPIKFKPGQLEWNKGNDWIKDLVEVDLFWNQLFHKVYHCNDSGTLPNWMIRLF